MGSRGLCVLVVNDDLICKNIVDEMLQHITHEVLHVGSVSDVLNMIWKKKDQFDLVLTNAHRLELEGLEVIQHIQYKFNLPTILMSPNKMKIELEIKACLLTAYAVKSLSRDEINYLWQSALERVKGKYVVTSLQGKSLETPMSGSLKQVHRKMNEQNESDRDDASIKKISWMVKNKFLKMIGVFRPKKAVPRNIVENVMVSELSRENAASHSQEYSERTNRDPDVNVNFTNTRNEHNVSCSLPSLLTSGFNSLQKNSSITKEDTSTYYQQGPHHLSNQTGVTGTSNMRQPQLLPVNNERDTRHLNTPSDTNWSRNSNSTMNFAGLSFGKDGKSIEFGLHKTPVHSAFNRALVSGSETTENKLSFLPRPISTSHHIQSNTTSDGNLSILNDSISMQPIGTFGNHNFDRCSLRSLSNQETSPLLPQLLQDRGITGNVLQNEATNETPHFDWNGFMARLDTYQNQMTAQHDALRNQLALFQFEVRVGFADIKNQYTRIEDKQTRLEELMAASEQGESSETGP